MSERITAGSEVTLHFSLSLADGQVIDSTRSRPEAPVLVVGDGQLLPGFEAVLLGLCAGDRRSIILPPESAFGAWNADNLQRFDLARFVDLPTTAGTVVSFTDQSRSELPGVVRAVIGDEVEVDFNHPLAGREVVFEVDILRVRAPDSQAVQWQEKA